MTETVRFTALMLVILLMTPLAAIASSPTGRLEHAGVQGNWEGELRTKRWPIFLSVEIRADDDIVTGSIAVLGQTIPLTEGEIEGNEFRVVSGGAGLVLEGRLQNGQLVGTLHEGEDEIPFTFDRVHELPPPADRIAAWHQDLDALSQRFVRWDRSFSPAERALFRERIERIRARLPGMNDDQIRMELAAAVSISGNAHTRLYLLRNRTELRRLPVRLWWFEESLRIVRATPEHAGLLGCRVDRIGAAPARHARDIVSAAFAGNASWRDYKSVYFLTSPEALHGFGLSPTADAVTLRLSDCAAAGNTKLEPLPLVKRTNAVESWWDLSPLHQDPDREWAHVLDNTSDPLPLYLRHPQRYYWLEFLPDSGILYFQYNRASNESNETTEQFGERLLAALDRHPVRALVLDLRFNTGGNMELAERLMERLQEQTSGIPRWVITGRATFSAGISHVASWKEAGNVTIVGENVGDELDMWSEGGNIILPNSGLAAHFANGAHSYSPAPCPTDTWCADKSSPPLDPDVPVMTSWDEYVSQRDPAMETIEAAEARRIGEAVPR